MKHETSPSSSESLPESSWDTLADEVPLPTISQAEIPKLYGPVAIENLKNLFEDNYFIATGDGETPEYAFADSLNESIMKGEIRHAEVLKDPFFRNRRCKYLYSYRENLRNDSTPFIVHVAWIIDPSFTSSTEYSKCLNEMQQNDREIFSVSDEKANEITSQLIKAIDTNKLSEIAKSYKTAEYDIDTIHELDRRLINDIFAPALEIPKEKIPKIIYQAYRNSADALSANVPSATYEPENDKIIYYKDKMFTDDFLNSDSLKLFWDHDSIISNRISKIAHEMFHTYELYGENVDEDCSEIFKINLKYLYIESRYDRNLYRQQACELVAFDYEKKVETLVRNLKK